MQQMDALELSELIDSDAELTLLDVREPDEFAFARIEGSMLIPLGELTERIGDLDPNRKTVVICHSGGRSDRAARFLEQRGFSDVSNLAGGILSWSRKVDPSVPTY